MEIFNNGSTITWGENEDPYTLMCTCGHSLGSHGVYVQYFYPDPTHHTGHSSQCISCGIQKDNFVCKRFVLNEN